MRKGTRVRIKDQGYRAFVVEETKGAKAYLVAEDMRSGGWHDLDTLIIVDPRSQAAEDAVVEAYRKALRFRARQVRIESPGGEETNEQQDERMEAICAFNDAELNYLGDQA